MVQKLKNSPLTYVLIQVTINHIGGLSQYIEEMQEAVRRDFPNFNTINIQAYEIKPNSNPTIHSITQWHFVDKRATTGILVSNDSIIIHTNQHDAFDILISRLESVLEKFNTILGISLCQRLGVRYINVIKTNLEEYLQPKLLGFYQNEHPRFKPNFLAKTESIQQTDIGFIKTQATHVSKARIKDGQNNLVPLDLLQNASYLNFDNEKQPKEEFVILDIDHYVEKQGNDFTIKNITKELKILHDGVYDVFIAAVTNKAMQDWS